MVMNLPEIAMVSGSGAVNAAKTPFQIAQEGGKHAGFLKNYIGRPASELSRGISSLEKEIIEHQTKIANPEKYLPHFRQLDPREQKALLEKIWPSHIEKQQEQSSILRSILGKG